jgi:hypothetical protein
LWLVFNLSMGDLAIYRWLTWGRSREGGLFIRTDSWS